MKHVLLLLVAACGSMYSQTNQSALMVTRIYGITSAWSGECAAGVIDNRSGVSRSSNLFTFYAWGTGTWSVDMQYSDGSCSAGPWTSFGVTVNQATSPPIGSAVGYHSFIKFVISGSATLNYSATKDFWPSLSGSGFIFPVTVPQGGTGSVTAAGAKDSSHLNIPFLTGDDFAFTVQAPGGTLIAGGVGQSISLAPCPVGLNGADVGHYVRLTAGSGGTAESTLITGGTCTSGAASGTITVTPTYNHGSGYTVGPASGGIQEAICSSSSGGEIRIGASTILNAAVGWCGKSLVALRVNSGVAFSGSGSLPTPDGSNTVWYAGVNYTGLAGVTTVYPPQLDQSNPVVVAPDGHLVSTAGSTTSGLQEGIDYALANGTWLHIAGGDQLQPGCGHSGPGPGPGCGATVYNVTNPAGVTFGPGQGWRVDSDPITINCTLAVTGPCVSIDSQMMSVFDLRGVQIVQFGSGPGLEFYPANPVPLDNTAGQIPFRFYMTTVACNTNPGHVCVNFKVGNGISGARIEIDELNGGDVGLQVFPSASNFIGNDIRIPFIHNQALGVGPVVSIGDAAAGTNNNNIYRNHWELGVGGPPANKRVYDLFQSHDTLYLDIDSMPAGANGIFFETAAGSAADYNLIWSQSPGQAFGCSGGCASTAHNRITYPTTRAATSITPGASPYSYRNLDMTTEMVCSSGGTVSAIALSPDNSTWVDTAAISGCWTLEPGDYLKVTYTVAPTMTKVK